MMTPSGSLASSCGGSTGHILDRNTGQLAIDHDEEPRGLVARVNQHIAFADLASVPCFAMRSIAHRLTWGE